MQYKSNNTTSVIKIIVASSFLKHFVYKRVKMLQPEKLKKSAVTRPIKSLTSLLTTWKSH